MIIYIYDISVSKQIKTSHTIIIAILLRYEITLYIPHQSMSLFLLAIGAVDTAAEYVYVVADEDAETW